MDFRTEPVETVLDVRTGWESIELRGAVDRAARRVSLAKPVSLAKRDRPNLARFTRPGIHPGHRLGVALYCARKPLTAHLVIAPEKCDRCGKATVPINLGIRDCPDRCRAPR